MIKKILRIALSVLAVIIIGEGVAVAVTSYLGSRNREYGLKMKVDESSPTEVTYTLSFEESDSDAQLSYGSTFGLQRWTLIGWRNVNLNRIFTAELYYVDSDMDPITWTSDLRARGEKNRKNLRPGIYRVYKNFFAGEQSDKSFGLYATFFVLF